MRQTTSLEPYQLNTMTNITVNSAKCQILGEIYVDSKGNAYLSQRGCARLIDKQPVYVIRYEKSLPEGVTKSVTLSAEIVTSKGKQGVTLYNSEFILDLCEKYKPELLKQFANHGVNSFLKQLANFEEQKPQVADLLPADVRVTNLANALDKFGFEMDNPRFKQGLQDLVGDILGVSGKSLPETPSEKWLGVAEKAQQMGYPVKLITRFRSSLGRYVASHKLAHKTEERLCNGTQRTIELYRDNQPLEAVIAEYLDAKL